MKADHQSQLGDVVDQARRSFHNLVLLVGQARTRKTGILQQFAKDRSCPLLNVNLEFSQRMLEVPRNKRASKADQVFKNLIDENGSDLLVLDNLEILFDPDLKLLPLKLLKSASANQFIVASWSGTLRNDVLTYAEPDHPEYKSYRNVDAITVLAGKKTLNN